MILRSGYRFRTILLPVAWDNYYAVFDLSRPNYSNSLTKLMITVQNSTQVFYKGWRYYWYSESTGLPKPYAFKPPLLWYSFTPFAKKKKPKQKGKHPAYKWGIWIWEEFMAKNMGSKYMEYKKARQWISYGYITRENYVNIYWMRAPGSSPRITLR